MNFCIVQDGVLKTVIKASKRRKGKLIVDRYSTDMFYDTGHEEIRFIDVAKRVGL